MKLFCASWLSRTLGLFVLFLTAAALAGCAGGGAASVGGNVKYKGQAVNGGSLTFTPLGAEREAGKPAAADVGADGGYKAAGVTIGKNRISYSAPSSDLPDRELKPGEAPPQSPYQGLVSKQSEVDIKSGQNALDIELVPPGK